MKVLVYGSNGWIGSQFTKLLKSNNVIYCEGEARADNTDDVISELLKTSPTHVIAFIGRTHGKIGEKIYTTIDYLEEPNKLQDNVRDNLFSPLVLAFLCQKLNLHFTYIGTGCIFKYDEKHLFGQEVNNSVLNLRIRMPITAEYNTRNFITKITTYEKICSIPNSMTVIPELLPKVLDMMKNRVTGTINLTNPGLISHNEILEMYREIVDTNFVWKNFSEKEQRKILTSDRSNNYLDTSRLEQLYPTVKNIKESVKECLIKMKNN